MNTGLTAPSLSSYPPLSLEMGSAIEINAFLSFSSRFYWFARFFGFNIVALVYALFTPDNYARGNKTAVDRPSMCDASHFYCINS